MTRPVVFVLVLSALLLAGCSHPRVDAVLTVVVPPNLGVVNVTVEAWDPDDHQVVDANLFVGGNGSASQDATPTIQGPAGDYTFRATALNHTHLQENIALSGKDRTVYVLVSAAEVDFSLDGKTPL